MGVVGDVIVGVGLQGRPQFNHHINPRQILGLDRHKKEKIEVTIGKKSGESDPYRRHCTTRPDDIGGAHESGFLLFKCHQTKSIRMGHLIFDCV